jgi:hypothetical protein
MGFLPSFVEDVFISYAHNDDDAYAMETQGWVAQLDEDLRKRVAVYLDGQHPAVWRDSDIRNNDDFAEKIKGRLVNTATFLSIISPSFFQRPWCILELEEFAASAQRNLGITIGEKNRIFKVEKVPVDFDRRNLPPQLQGTGSYRFHGPDPEHKGRIHEYRPRLGMEYAARYYREMDDLAQDIAQVLKNMYSSSGKAPKVALPEIDRVTTVYLAETTSDLDDRAKEVRRDLKARGCIVLPEGDLPYRVADMKAKVQHDLESAQMSIHMVGANYGFIPEGEAERSNAWLQYEYAVQHQARTPGFVRLLWMPLGLTPEEPRQQRFVEYLQNDVSGQRNSDMVESRLEDLKTLIQEKIKAISKVAPVPNPGSTPSTITQSDELLRVYVICDKLDLHSADLMELRNYLFAQGYECILPSEVVDEAEALQEHAENLEICDAWIIYYGQGSDRWFSTKLRELRKLLIGRRTPLRAKAVYVASPASETKAALQTLEAQVLRGEQNFSGDILAPFLARMRSSLPRAGA